MGCDDKGNVFIGIPAATKQQQVLCRFDSPIRLPPHQYIIANGYSIKPSVYAEFTVAANEPGRHGAVSYSGKTDVKLRINKYCKSTASTHRVDLSNIFKSDKRYQMEDGRCRPILLLDSDGGPDWNYKFEGTQNNLIQFAVEHDLDFFALGHHPGGCSPEGRQERRMAPLTKDLVALILPHNKYGDALNKQKKTVDVALEKRNLHYSQQMMASI